MYADARLEIDHRLRIDAAGLLMPAGTAIGGRSAVSAAGIADVIGDQDPVEVIAEPGVVFGPFRDVDQAGQAARRRPAGPRSATDDVAPSGGGHRPGG